MVNIVIILLFIVLPVFADELPEPTEQNIGYECEIGYGTLSGIVWQPQAIEYQVVDGQPSDGHAYWSTLGIQRFEAVSCIQGKKVIFWFEINQIPDGLPFLLYRVRIRGYIDNIKSEWSDPSYWVCVVNLRIPSRPIH